MNFEGLAEVLEEDLLTVYFQNFNVQCLNQN